MLCQKIIIIISYNNFNETPKSVPTQTQTETQNYFIYWNRKRLKVEMQFVFNLQKQVLGIFSTIFFLLKIKTLENHH